MPRKNNSRPCNYGLPRLIQLKEDRGWSYSDIGNMLGVKKQIVHAWVRGIYRPSALRMRQLCGIFDVDEETMKEGANWESR